MISTLAGHILKPFSIPFWNHDNHQTVQSIIYRKQSQWTDSSKQNSANPEWSDQDLHCLSIHMHLLNMLVHCKIRPILIITTCIVIITGVPVFCNFYVI